MSRFHLVPALLAALVSLSAFAMPEKFEGKIVDATYSDLIGRSCSVKFKELTPDGDQTFLYVAFPKVKGETYSILNRVRPPARKFYVTDLNGGDLFARKGELVGNGSKHKHGRIVDASQRLYLEMDASGEKVVGFRALDQWYGNLLVCR